ncbi:DUF6751 family protein [Anaerosacchariphilus polymeriproducens]|uniref:Uncharacterized protein n=1 Tax=Anaerosacchariphilus polymeriproducens TaxID=1812858 RepID=A0A371AQS7_9FIRM|nr:DUF6751 family protein [Anaerosacchariphilus polymeriproducens]RDU21936.1 hypothetical protein DWV06_15475 [Anaerosacchariphilus polymeriproducens]
MYTNADITLYQYSSSGYVRKVVNGVFWNEVKQSNVMRSGIANADSVVIFIPKSNVTDLEITTSKDLVVNGVIDFEFDNATSATISASMSTLIKTYDTHTITAFDKKIFGSEKMHHYQLSCK